jgi:hypothetical protein
MPKFQQGCTPIPKFPFTIEREQDLNPTILRELLVFYAKQLVSDYGDFLDADIKFCGEIFLTLHEGKIGKGSKASLDFQVHPPYVKMREE